VERTRLRWAFHSVPSSAQAARKALRPGRPRHVPARTACGVRRPPGVQRLPRTARRMPAARARSRRADAAVRARLPRAARWLPPRLPPPSHLPTSTPAIGLHSGRGIHSSIYQLNLRHLCHWNSMKGPNVFHKQCSRQAGKWTSASPCSAASGNPYPGAGQGG